jgi:hypothetical protein
MAVASNPLKQCGDRGRHTAAENGNLDRHAASRLAITGPFEPLRSANQHLAKKLASRGASCTATFVRIHHMPSVTPAMAGDGGGRHGSAVIERGLRYGIEPMTLL